MVCSYFIILLMAIYKLINEKIKNVHLEKFIEIPKKFENIELSKKWIELKKIRDACNISIEAKRAKKDIGSSLEANLYFILKDYLKLQKI